MTQETFQKPDGWAEFSTRSKVIWWLAELLQKNQSDITGQTSLTNDLGADSLDLVEIVMRFEDEFGIFITDQEAESLKTVDQVVDYIGKKLSGAIPNIPPPTDPDAITASPDFE